ncbi:C45 family peptidase [Paenarthrobacter sp. GOM3]|uniref:C45 family autoproteolytic acyltransferase/hydolase n=1 Tax=Paenarthrobacter sp. GOM3 TaxID=2782567 RepID=UPI001BABD761|nr:C45 family peptidase [Paenarthrobacter sp. GOM3]WOH19543.1 C45 family peptidase [Paenarthrobacter sp. GOM3]
MELFTTASTTQDPEQRGEELGLAFGDKFSTVSKLYLEHFEGLNIPVGTVRRIAETSRAALAAWAPALAVEAEAIARAARLEPWELAAVGARTEILAAQPPRAEGECSTAVFTGAGRAPETMQTWDWHDFLVPAAVLFDFVSDVGRKVKMFTEFGTAAKIGVNDAGVGLHFNILAHSSDSDQGGVPVHAIARRVLDEATSLEDAHSIAASATASASTCLTVFEARQDGSLAASFELSPAGMGVVRPGQDGWLFHTNHFLNPGLRKGDTMPADSSTVERYQHLDAVRGTLAGHGPAGRASAACVGAGEKAPICMTADTSKPLIDQWRTLLTISVDAKEFALDFYPGRPDEAATYGLARF